ncbi:putative peptide methionine sulfoxide reductase [Endogone sp. FLAS-F59071]|nr:putative peptide methionine sulfoxide reductase [Endogone sp. FLAS-F59071]|eukprot:RUS18370.1 putative peptide methionine sulfoxide reductase [Endogone sp. FLAS-F59071]
MAEITTEKATFAAGCFWGVEKMYVKHFKGKGLLETRVGYIGGKPEIKDPTYQQVCSGATDHAEAIEIKFAPDQVSYAKLVNFFYSMHDPTQVNRQGPDQGTQYRSAIFYHTPEQREIAERVTTEVQEEHYQGQKIATQIVEADTFYDAEEYHQMYLEKNPSGYEVGFSRGKECREREEERGKAVLRFEALIEAY